MSAPLPDPGSVRITEADTDLWQQYDALATPAYGHPVEDIARLRRYADLRVAVRDGRVIAGGLGLLIGQYFGGPPCTAPSAAPGASRRKNAGAASRAVCSPSESAPSAIRAR
ncbi:hypothetical protein ACWFQ8_32140 [Streptomyces sp. NPDC055254]